MSSASHENFLDQALPRSQLKDFDHYIETIVKQVHEEGEKKISWKHVSQLILKRFSVKLPMKHCERRYFFPNKGGKITSTKKLILYLRLNNKFENRYLICTTVGLTDNKFKKNSIFHHCKEFITSRNEASFKNIIKVMKESMGRVLRGIYHKKVKEANIPQTIFKQKKDHFKIFMILFSTSQLLNYYRAHPKLPVSITDFRSNSYEQEESIIQYSQTKKKCFKLKKNSCMHIKYQETIVKKEVQIKQTLQKILGLYESIYSDKQRRSKLIGTKDKNLEDKFKYLKSILMGIPVKVSEGKSFLQKEENRCEEFDMNFGLIKNFLELGDNLFQHGETREEIQSKHQMNQFNDEQEDDQSGNFFYLPFQMTDSIQKESMMWKPHESGWDIQQIDVDSRLA